ncbi:MAG: binding domain protein [Symbiobacteriaceae bacterium]|nr:binding domain protein [Symbiobacteriaceae bacterium]
MQEFVNRNNETENAEDRAELEAALRVLKEGEIVMGIVVSVNDDYVMVDVGYKSEGTINLNEVTHRPLKNARESGLKPGDQIRVMVYALDPSGEGGLRLSIRRVAEAEAWESIVKKFEAGEVIESEREGVEKSFWGTVEEGQVREGTVKSLTDFGAFIDLGGVDGLLHISEMSYGRIKHPSQVIKEGEKLQVKVLRLDREKKKVSLGLKQVMSDPWVTAVERYAEGTIVTGTVARLATFGAFVELEPGVDGLIHISQLADHRVNTPGDVVQVGQVVQAKVVGVNPEQRRISLSLRDALAPAVEEAAETTAAAEQPAEEPAEEKTEE